MILSRQRGLPSPIQPPSPAANDKERRRAMTYGLSTRAFIEDGPAVQVINAEVLRSTARSWHALDADRRLALIERALKPANDLIDAFPWRSDRDERGKEITMIDEILRSRLSRQPRRPQCQPGRHLRRYRQGDRRQLPGAPPDRVERALAAEGEARARSLTPKERGRHALALHRRERPLGDGRRAAEAAQPPLAIPLP